MIGRENKTDGINDLVRTAYSIALLKQKEGAQRTNLIRRGRPKEVGLRHKQVSRLDGGIETEQ